MVTDFRERNEALGAMLLGEPTIYAVRNLAAYCGEGSYGGDGYVALIHRDSDEPIWIAFFDESNPFVSVEITTENVIAVSNHGSRWRFPIGAPENVVVE